MLGALQRNPQFRRLWLSQLVSQTGNWFNRIAVLTLIDRLSGPTAAIGGMYALELASRLLPTAAFSSLAGPVADRLPRRALMVGADLLQAVFVLLLIACDGPGGLGLLYVLVAAQVGTSVFFYAAQSASIPNTVPTEELHEATAVSAATWSFALALGTLLGAFAVGPLGVGWVFGLNAATFLVSAALLARLELPPPQERDTEFRWRDIVLFTEMRAGLRHVRELGIVPMVVAKLFWGAAGGYLVLIPIMATRQMPNAPSESIAIGVLFCARGLGTAVGPILARRYWGSDDKSLFGQVSAGFVVAAVFYAGFGATQSLIVGFLLVACAHVGGSTIWVASTTYWQRHVDDAFRGRVYALEFLGNMLSFTVGSFLAGEVYDRWGSTAGTSLVVSGLVLVCGLSWTLLAMRKLRVASEASSA